MGLKNKLVGMSPILGGLFALSTKAVLAADTFCSSSTSSNPTINTALGCIPVDTTDFITWLLPYLFGIAGGISFLLMVFGFIKITTSNGDPKAIQGAKETITSAIMGLLLSIFSIFILRLIVTQILVIPGVTN